MDCTNNDQWILQKALKVLCNDAPWCGGFSCQLGLHVILLFLLWPLLLVFRKLCHFLFVFQIMLYHAFWASFGFIIFSFWQCVCAVLPRHWWQWQYQHIVFFFGNFDVTGRASMTTQRELWSWLLFFATLIGLVWLAKGSFALSLTAIVKSIKVSSVLLLASIFLSLMSSLPALPVELVVHALPVGPSAFEAVMAMAASASSWTRAKSGNTHCLFAILAKYSCFFPNHCLEHCFHAVAKRQPMCKGNPNTSSLGMTKWLPNPTNCFVI